MKGVRAAIATCKGRVCQRLDCADELVVLDVRGDRTCDRRALNLNSWPVHGRSARIEQLNVDQLICGAVSDFDGAGLDDSSIRLISDVTGPVEAVIGAILSGAIASGQSYWQGHADKRSRGS